MKNIFAPFRRKLSRKKQREQLPLRAFKEFEDSVNLIEDYDHISRNFLGKIREVIPESKLILLTFDADTGRFVCAASANATEDEVRTISLARNSRLVKWLKVNETHLDLSRKSDVLEYLMRRETDVLEALGVEMSFPLISMNRLIGILLVGTKPGRAPLTKVEISFITSLLPPASIGLENALLFKEQRERLRRMSRADKLATVGELAAGAAHEIRNPLTAIRSSLQYLESKSQDETSRKLLESAVQETERIDKIVSALLSFSRPSEIVRERHELHETIEESLELVSFQAKTQNVAVSLDVPPTPLLIRGDRAQLKQLFLNVFLNALQAMSGGGRLTVKALLKDGRKAVVTVADTGEGILEETMDRIFDPFFTTKKGGTGLGLSICYNIVKSHKGDIEVKSQPGQGTTVLISLPLY
jgi:two-component system, NtrC family, sensor kinase